MDILHVPQAVQTLDAIFNAAIATATDVAEVNRLGGLKVAVKRQLGSLPDQEIPVAAARILKALTVSEDSDPEGVA